MPEPSDPTPTQADAPQGDAGTATDTESQRQVQNTASTSTARPRRQIRVSFDDFSTIYLAAKLHELVRSGRFGGTAAAESTSQDGRSPTEQSPPSEEAEGVSEDEGEILSEDEAESLPEEDEDEEEDELDNESDEGEAEDELDNESDEDEEEDELDDDTDRSEPSVKEEGVVQREQRKKAEAKVRWLAKADQTYTTMGSKLETFLSESGAPSLAAADGLSKTQIAARHLALGKAFKDRYTDLVVRHADVGQHLSSLEEWTKSLVVASNSNPTNDTGTSNIDEDWESHVHSAFEHMSRVMPGEKGVPMNARTVVESIVSYAAEEAKKRHQASIAAPSTSEEDA